MVKLAFVKNKIGKRYVRVLNNKEKLGGKFKDEDGIVWDIKTDLDGNVIIVRNSRIKEANYDFDDRDYYFSIREIKGFVDVDRLVAVNIKTEIEINGERCDAEISIEKDDVTGEYNVVVKSESEEIDGLGFSLPEEVGMVLDAIDEPELLMNVLEKVIMSDSFKEYVLSELGLNKE